MDITNRLKGLMSAGLMSRFLSRLDISNASAIMVAAIAGIVVAIFVWMIPVWRLESFTSATGLSEIIPATAAPLGSTARAIMVMFSAILAASIFLVAFLSFRPTQKDNDDDYMDTSVVNQKAKERFRMPVIDADNDIAQKIETQDEERYQRYVHQNNTSDSRRGSRGGSRRGSRGRKRKSHKKINVPAIMGTLTTVGAAIKSRISSLPFMGGDNSVRSFDDLPKLRDADKHPDAPARRPLSAHEDLGEKLLPPINLGSETNNRQDHIPNRDHDDGYDIDAYDHAAHDIDAHDIDTHDIDTHDYAALHNQDDEAYNHINATDYGVSDNEDAYDLTPEFVAEDLAEDLAEGFADTDIHTKVSIEDNGLEANEHYIDETELNAQEWVADAVISQADDLPEVTDMTEADDLPTLDNLLARFETAIVRRKKAMAKMSIDKENAEQGHKINIAATNIAATDIAATNIDEQVLIDPLDISDDINFEHDAEKIMAGDGSIDGSISNSDISKPLKDRGLKRITVKDTQDIEDKVVANESQKAEMDSALQSALSTLHKINQKSA